MNALPVFIKCTKILQNIVIELNRDVIVKKTVDLGNSHTVISVLHYGLKITLYLSLF